MRIPTIPEYQWYAFVALVAVYATCVAAADGKWPWVVFNVALATFEAGLAGANWRRA